MLADRNCDRRSRSKILRDAQRLRGEAPRAEDQHTDEGTLGAKALLCAGSALENVLHRTEFDLRRCRFTRPAGVQSECSVFAAGFAAARNLTRALKCLPTGIAIGVADPESCSARSGSGARRIALRTNTPTSNRTAQGLALQPGRVETVEFRPSRFTRAVGVQSERGDAPIALAAP